MKSEKNEATIWRLFVRKKGEKFNKKTNQREPTRAIIAEEFFAIP